MPTLMKWSHIFSCAYVYFPCLFIPVGQASDSVSSKDRNQGDGSGFRGRGGRGRGRKQGRGRGKGRGGKGGNIPSKQPTLLEKVSGDDIS